MAREHSRTGIIITHIKESCISFTHYFSTCGINYFVAKIAEWGPLSMTYTCNTPPLGLPCREGTLPLLSFTINPLDRKVICLFVRLV